VTAAATIRRLEDADLEVLNRVLPVWSGFEYEQRLRAQTRAQMVQVVAWEERTPVGRGMVLFPEHDEFSASAVREGCAEVRDVFVAPAHRNRGLATAMMAALEDGARERGMVASVCR
jgi:GNAT superfamily N-acetyltransferase